MGEVDAILNQKEINAKAKTEAEKLYSVYVAVGQKRSTVVSSRGVLARFRVYVHSALCVVRACLLVCLALGV